METHTALRDACQGMMVGMALGDGLGYRVEFLSHAELIAAYGPQGIQDPPLHNGAILYTDDTQMALALAQGLLEAKEDWHVSVAGAFVRWLRSPDNDRAPGRTCIAGCTQLERGVPWSQAGNPQSKGCGSVMRVAPVGALYWNDLDALRCVAREQSLMTHGHPTALVASIAGAYAVALLLQGTSPTHLVSLVRAFVAGEPGSGEVVSILERVEQVSASDRFTVSEALGSGWIAEEALAIALWAFVRGPNDPAGVMRCAVNFPGRGGSCDRDSVGAIAGAFAGAYNRLSALPLGWVRCIENGALLLQIGSKLAEVSYSNVDGR